MRGPPHATRVDLFGGQGEVRLWDLLGAATAAAPFTTVLWCELAPGGRVGAHRQADDAELVIGLGGQGRAFVGDVEHALGEGAVVSLPLGAILRLENLGDAPLRYLIVKARP
ncbi:MAG: cupin domain-containing protein [Myxococcales bacterium]|nr:cupin domain-containing protein [Myxococcales bacterium]MCB9544794.1 cupin domain-containing protein [Myxococcales bacterium]